MLKHDYFLAALQAGAYQYKEWIIECFGTVALPEKPKVSELETIQQAAESNNYAPLVYPGEPSRYTFEKYPYQLFKDDDIVVFMNHKTNLWEPLQGVKIGAPFFKFKDEIKLLPGDLENVDREIITWYGNTLVNKVILCHSFGSTIPFITGQIKISKIEEMIAELLTVPEDGVEKDRSKIYVDDLESLYYQSAYSVTGWCQLAAPAATPYTITIDPEIRKRRKELLLEYQDQLNNPAIVAKIMGELIDMDKKFQDKDPEKGFLKPGKDFDVVRAKMYLMHGIEYDFTDRSKITVIENSLSEQWDITKLPEMANSLIDGSFNRGFLTALGGEAAKFLARFFLNTNITEVDCGSTLGIYHTITDDNESDFLWTYAINNDGTDTLITPRNIDELKGKPILLRSPQYCHTENGDLCVHCMGKRFENSKESLSALATEAGNTMMSIFMRKMHGVALKTVKWDWKVDLF